MTAAAHATRYSHTEAGKEYQRAYQRARYERAKAAGLCLQCKKAQRPPGRAFCDPCAPKKKRVYRAWQRRMRRAKGVPTRRCIVCREAGHNIKTCRDKPAPRCRCGLLLPCDDCPTAATVAERRASWD